VVILADVGNYIEEQLILYDYALSCYIPVICDIGTPGEYPLNPYRQNPKRAKSGPRLLPIISACTFGALLAQQGVCLLFLGGAEVKREKFRSFKKADQEDGERARPKDYERRMKMAECEVLSSCVFFNDKMEKMPATAEGFKRQYCRGDNSKCARYMVLKALGRPKVPIDLFPNQEDRAREIMTG
jgi:hypothetical protein